MKLAVRHQIGYASGNLGKSLMWTSLEYFLLFYLIEFAGLAPELAGAIILISLVWDGAINPAIGYWIDRRAAIGRDSRLFLRCAPPVAGLLFLGLFALPPGGAVAFFLVLMAFRTAYALFDVPHNALMASLPVPAETRTRLASMRFFFSSLGGLIVSTSVAPVIAPRTPTGAPPDLRILAAGAGFVLCLSLWQSLAPARLAVSDRFARPIAIDPRRYLARILADRVAMTYLGFAALFAVTAPLFAKSLPFVLTYVQRDPALLPTLLVAMIIGQLFAMALLTWLASDVAHARTVPLSLAGLLVSCGLFYGTLNAGVVLLGTAAALFGFFLASTIMSIWAMAGEVADHLAAGEQARADAGLVALLTLVQKAGIGIGAILAGAILRFGGFAAGRDQDAGAMDAILLVALGVPALGAAATFLVFRRLRTLLP